MSGFWYDILMNFGPVIIVGFLTYMGVKKTLSQNEKMEFNRGFKSRKNTLEHALSHVNAAYHTLNGMEVTGEELNELVQSMYLKIEPSVNGVIRSEIDVENLRDTFGEFEMNVTKIRLKFKVDQYKQKQVLNLYAVSSEIRNLIVSLEAEYKIHNKREVS